MYIPKLSIFNNNVFLIGVKVISSFKERTSEILLAAFMLPIYTLMLQSVRPKEYDRSIKRILFLLISNISDTPFILCPFAGTGVLTTGSTLLAYLPIKDLVFTSYFNALIQAVESPVAARGPSS